MLTCPKQLPSRRALALPWLSQNSSLERDFATGDYRVEQTLVVDRRKGSLFPGVWTLLLLSDVTMLHCPCPDAKPSFIGCASVVLLLPSGIPYSTSVSKYTEVGRQNQVYLTFLTLTTACVSQFPVCAIFLAINSVY